jgi:hypothetical protein
LKKDGFRAARRMDFLTGRLQGRFFAPIMRRRIIAGCIGGVSSDCNVPIKPHPRFALLC